MRHVLAPVAFLFALGCAGSPAEPDTGTGPATDGADATDAADGTDGTDGTPTTDDTDGDGFTVEEGDCDDADATRHPFDRTAYGEDAGCGYRAPAPPRAQGICRHARSVPPPRAAPLAMDRPVGFGGHRWSALAKYTGR